MKFLYKCPAGFKILFIPVISILTLLLPPYFCLSLIIIQFILLLIHGFSLRAQLKDLRPLLYYIFLLLTVKILSILMEFFTIIPSFMVEKTFNFEEFWLWLKARLLFDTSTFFMLSKIFCLLQTASLLFKTSTSLQIREAFEKMELFVRRLFTKKTLKAKNKSSSSEDRLSLQTFEEASSANDSMQKVPSTPFATALSMFVNFIPMVSSIWAQSKKAWFARGGKKGLKMYMSLLPVLFSVGMKKAWNTARAFEARS